MTHSRQVIRFSYIVGLILTSSLVLTMPATAANCEKNPDHHQCPGGGGGGGGGEDPASNPALTFTRKSNDAVNVIDIDGSNNTSIFGRKEARGISAWEVRWSPIDDLILYSDNYENLFYIVDDDGSNRRSITPSVSGFPVGPGSHMEWRLVDAPLNGSPERIFFTANPLDDGNSRVTDLYTMDPHSGSIGDAIILSEPNDTDRIHGLAVSSDGLRVIVIYYEDDYYTADAQLWLYDLGVMNNELYLMGKTQIIIDPLGMPGEQFDPYELKWSNGGRWVLFTHNNNQYVMDVDTSEVTALIGGGAPINLGCPRSATWSPDDSMIAFDIQCYDNQPKHEGIHVVDFIPGDPINGEPPYVTNVRQITTGLGRISLDWRSTWMAAP